jgi:hypothetical protein
VRLILDQNFPKPVARALTGHIFATAYSMGWGNLANGDLLAAAEAAGFELLLTSDQRIRYQQNLAGRCIALVVTSLNSRPVLLQHVGLIQAAVNRAHPGSYEEVEIPRPPLQRRAWPKAEP